MKITQLAWYARRARTMERGELRSRFTDALDSAGDFLRVHLGGRSTYQRNRHSARFRFCDGVEPLLPALRWNFEPVQAEIDALLAGVHHALGFSWRWQPGGAAWHRAPDTGNTWPIKFSDLIEHRPGNPVGDVRVMWEPNRLQQLVSLALLTRAAPASGAMAAILLKQQLLCWLAANPMRRGVNYISSMECALRILSVTFASDLARPFLARDQAYWTAVAKLVLEHAAFVNARLSLFSSLGNHTVAECTGLYVAALLFPEAEAAAGWETRASEVLTLAIGREILPDGGAAEQALHYHAQVLDHIEIAIRVGRHCGRDVAAWEAAHRSGAAFLAGFHTDRRHLPTIGDDDDGHALSRHFMPSWAEDAKWNADTRPNASISLWSGGGYSIIRSLGDEAALILDHGPLGMPPNCGHGHADALALQMHIRGEPVLVDPGTYSYGAEPQWRRYFRDTAAHNTVTVDDRGQARQAGPFLWATSYDCRLLHADLEHERSAVIVARHDGYAARGVFHIRAVMAVPGTILVVDRLEGDGAHDLALHWHFAGRVRSAGGAYRLDDIPGLRCIAQGGDARILEGSETPAAGWRSERYGRKCPIRTLELRATASLPHEFVTVFLLPAAPDRRDWEAEARILGNLIDALGGQDSVLASRANGSSA